jgi:hypothetical protein
MDINGLSNNLKEGGLVPPDTKKGTVLVYSVIIAWLDEVGLCTVREAESYLMVTRQVALRHLHEMHKHRLVSIRDTHKGIHKTYQLSKRLEEFLSID